MGRFLLHILGVDDPNSPFYLAYSGIIPSLAIVGGVVTFIRRHQCHSPWCIRMGRHQLDGTLYCTKHHPRR